MTETNQRATYCERHPEVESQLRCSKCDVLICSRCLIHTPVGARCPVCADVRKDPIAHTPSLILTRTILAALGTSAGLSLAYFFLLPLFGPLAILVALGAPVGIGYVVGEVVYRASGYRRSSTLAWVATGCFVAGLASVILAFNALGINLLGVLIGAFLAMQRVRP